MCISSRYNPLYGSGPCRPGGGGRHWAIVSTLYRPHSTALPPTLRCVQLLAVYCPLSLPFMLQRGLFWSALAVLRILGFSVPIPHHPPWGGFTWGQGAFFFGLSPVRLSFASASSGPLCTQQCFQGSAVGSGVKDQVSLGIMRPVSCQTPAVAAAAAAAAAAPSLRMHVPLVLGA